MLFTSPATSNKEVGRGREEEQKKRWGKGSKRKGIGEKGSESTVEGKENLKES